MMPVQGTLQPQAASTLAAGLGGLGISLPAVGTNANTSIMQNTAGNRYKKFCLIEAPTQRIVWVPADSADLLPTAVDAVEHPTTDSTDNLLYATLVATAAAQTFEVKYDIHVELVPTPGSLMCGLETIEKSNQRPQDVWKTILVDKSNLIITSGKEQHVTSNITQFPMLTTRYNLRGPILRGKK
jgi:hypothetical protein